MLRFSCEKALLQSAVNTVSRAVAAKSSIPALEGILVEGSDRLTMSGYNMQTGIRTAFEAEVHEEGRIVLNARLFGEIIRKLPDDLVVVRQIVECCFIQPKERPYQTNNAYTALMRQSQMEKEVNAIVQKAKERNERKSAGQAHPRRKERDSGRHPKV